MMNSYQELASLDKRYIWHPFTQMADWQKEDILIIEEAKGCTLKDVNGRTYLDGVSSLWCNVHGHQRPEIDEAIKDQLGKVAHSTFLGLSNVPAIKLAEKLIQIAPEGLQRVFYSDSGASAVEVALKMAYQYWQHRGLGQKQKFARLKNAYHGDTIGAVSLGGIALFHQIFKPFLFDTYEVPSPYCYRWPSANDPQTVKTECLRAIETLFEREGESIAALIVEPLMQGAAGMIDQPTGFIKQVREITKRHSVLLIFDEVATGFGRTGKMFAAEHEGVTPDLMTLAKGITGGYLPLSATLATEEIYTAFLGNYDEFKTFFHGHTYTGNPLACRAASASLEIMEKEGTIQGLVPKIALLESELAKIATLEHVGDVRQKGLMVGIELVQERATKAPFALEQKVGIRVCERARDKGVWIRPLGNVIVLMPPLAMSLEELSRLTQAVYESIEEVTSKFLKEGVTT